jgi:hypothetical protein
MKRPRSCRGKIEGASKSVLDQMKAAVSRFKLTDERARRYLINARTSEPGHSLSPGALAVASVSLMQARFPDFRLRRVALARPSPSLLCRRVTFNYCGVRHNRRSTVAGTVRALHPTSLVAQRTQKKRFAGSHLRRSTTGLRVHGKSRDSAPTVE